MLARIVSVALFFVGAWVLGPLLGMWMQRWHLTRNWQEARRSFPAPERIGVGGGWRKAFVRDKRGGLLLIFRIHPTEDGLLIREYNPIEFLGILRLRAMFVPWNAFSNAHPVVRPWYSFVVAERIELELDGFPVSVVVAKDFYETSIATLHGSRDSARPDGHGG